MKKVSLLHLLVLTLLIIVSFSAKVLAQQSSSTNYQVNEVFFGTGGELNACSGSYCAKQSAGELTVGNTKSANYQAQAGFNTDRTPWIAVQVTGATANADGVLSTSVARTANAQFRVSAYLTSGYVVQTWGNGGMRNGTAQLQNLSTPTASVVGTEQFGMNLVANTSPATFGADPVQSPDYPAEPFAFGQAAADYNTPNLYKYADGDVIAESTKSSSFTDYTIAYIFNISSVTPGGTYLMNQSLVGTATF